MTAIEIVYLLAFVMGMTYAVFAGIFSGLFGSGGHGFDVDHDVGGTVETGGPDHGTIHFSPFSPIVISMFVGSFGAVGILCVKLFKISQTYVHMPISVASGFVIAGISTMLFTKLFKATQSSSEATITEIIGQEAEVITPIPQNGLGEIAYTVKGTRYTAPAKTIGGVSVDKHTVVVIDKVLGGTCFVSRKLGI